MATKRLVWCFLFFVFATVSVHSKFARGKPRERSKSSHREGVRGSGSGYGERLPWEGRQETYDWAFKEADFYKKIRATWDNNYVGSVEESLNKPFCGTLNATQETTFYGKWHADDDGHYWWEPQNCRLRRLSAVEARQCLNGKHLFFGGDSLTRYQYLSFVSFLSKGVYMAPWAHGDVRSLAVEREWDGWDDFFKSGSLMLATEAVNGTAKEECDCIHGAYGGFSDVPSHEIREFSLTNFPTLRENKSKRNIIKVSNKLVYNHPSHIQAGIELLMFALKRLVQISSKPDLVILNMGIWVRDWTASGQDYKERFETILQHGNYFRNDTDGKKTRLLWKTTTNTVGDVVEEESWNAVNEGSLRAVEATPGWQLLDIRALSRQSLEQHLNLYSFDAVHFAPQMYQEFNDFLLNIICSPQLEFQDDNLPPDKSSRSSRV